MAAFAPFGRDRRLAVAVSGGADSMALAVLLAAWGGPRALIVDHGLRPESAAEAALTSVRLAGLSIGSDVLALSISGATSGRVSAEQARDARYAALETYCAEAGLPDLLIAHHARDQAETIALRTSRGSGASGLAGMASVAFTDKVRRLRPLLRVEPARLRATLRAAGVEWVEDPSNRDLATPRARLRAAGPSPADDGVAAAHRRRTEQGVAAELAAVATLLPCGAAFVAAPALSPAALSALIWTVGGGRHPPRPASVAALAPRLRPATLGGAVIISGRGGWWIGREAGAMAPETRATEWDGRFWRSAGAGLVGPLGADASALRSWSSLPWALLRTVPAIRRDHESLAVPHLAYPDARTCGRVALAFRPARPAAPAPFAVT